MNYVLFTGFIWGEIKQMWDGGLQDYIHDWWNLMDFVMNSLYLATISLKIVAFSKVNCKKNQQHFKDKLNQASSIFHLCLEVLRLSNSRDVWCALWIFCSNDRKLDKYKSKQNIGFYAFFFLAHVMFPYFVLNYHIVKFLRNENYL